MHVILEIAGQAKLGLEYAKYLGVYKMFSSLKLLLEDGETQNINVLAQKSNIGIVKKKLDGLDRDIILEKDVKKNIQLLKQVK